MIECCSGDFEEEFIGLWGGSGDGVEGESVVVVSGGDSDRFWHGAGRFGQVLWVGGQRSSS